VSTTGSYVINVFAGADLKAPAALALAEPAHALARRLYDICEQKRWAAEDRVYNQQFWCFRLVAFVIRSSCDSFTTAFLFSSSISACQAAAIDTM